METIVVFSLPVDRANHLVKRMKSATIVPDSETPGFVDPSTPFVDVAVKVSRMSLLELYCAGIDFGMDVIMSANKKHVEPLIPAEKFATYKEYVES